MFLLTQEQVDLLDAVDRTSPTRFADINDLLHFFVQLPDAFGNLADGNVIQWLGAAKDANRGVGGASAFIRSYTEFQLEMRNGGPVAGIDQIVQSASNAIAKAVYDDIKGSQVVRDGVTYYEMPTAYEIGEKDALATVTALAANIPSYSGGAATWSGNPLFVGLGIADFWSENVLDFTNDGYDLALSVGAMFHALGATSGTGLIDLFLQFVGQGIIPAIQTGISSGGAAANATDAYLVQAYGETNLGVHDLVVGALQVGSAANDSFYTSGFTESLGWVHAGAGADIIYAASDSSSQLDSAGVFDGGDGNDLVTFYHATIYEDGGVSARLTDWESDVPFSAVVDMPFGAQAFLFNIERLDLSEADDRLVIETVTTTLQRVDAAASLDHGDTIDLSYVAGRGAAVSLVSGTLGLIGEQRSLEVGGFENVVGTSQADILTGNEQANGINGHLGADILFGGGGDDFIFFDAEDILVNGGAGRDVAVAVGQAGVTVDMLAQGLEVVVGSDSADTIIMGGSPDILFAAGGGGADAFVINYDETESPRVIWGGEGADVYDFSDGFGGGIAVVRIAGLTEEMFASMSIEDLNLGDLNLSSFRAIIINPDESDRFRVGGGVFSSDEMPGDVEWKSFSFAGHEHLDSLEGAIGRPLAVQGGFERDHQFEATLEVERDEFENVLSIKDYTGRWLADGTDEFDFYEYDPNDQADQDAAAAFINTRDDEPVFRMTQVETNPQYGPWYGTFFVVGGEFGGSSLSDNGELIAPTPAGPVETPFDWLLAA